MSHKHNNYTNYSNCAKPQEAPVVEPEVKNDEEEVVTPVVEPEVKNDEEEVVTPVTPVVPEEEPVSDELIGVVTDCAKLNVRAEASKDADVVTTIALGTEVQIDIFESTDEFYKVTTATGVEGFCMKKFINID